ncbi:MAG TPA: protein kinase, partial [Thermoanaerobaculia bacterium]|nr:protein kinase [Thermoanaerobaculia bacterium]
MPLILVVESDDRVATRVRQALGPEGWSVVHAPGVTQAMQAVASEAPDLFLVAAELQGAGKVLASFARRQGGPGTVALLPAGAAAPPPGEGGADASLPRSFGSEELRAVVERILRTGDRPTGPAAGEPKLTSQDIFGDLVAEVEGGAELPAALVAPPPPAPPRRRPTGDAEIERKLEETLSGVLGWVPKERPAPARAIEPAPPPPARPARVRQPQDDLDKLISATLSGLELSAGRSQRREGGPPGKAPAAPPEAAAPPSPKPPAQAPPTPPVRSARPPGPEEFRLSDLEALLARPRKTPPAPPPPVERAPRAEEPPPEPPPLPAEPPPPFELDLAESIVEVAEEAAPADRSGDAAPPAAVGTEFGQYRLLERIGIGGMAEVWKARMTGVEGFQKTVAIKRILPHLTDSPDFVEMFVDEAKLAAQLNHANVIHIYDLGKIGADYYIAMEHVEGENLRRILERGRETGKPIPVGLALYVAARLASALDHAHRKRDFEGRELGLVHRDVSPQNVLVGYEGTIKLCDFGIVKAVSKSSHTQRGALKGKLQYMSPEQAWGRAVDGRSDIFSVGALLFEMLTGRRLFVGDSEMEVLEAVRECRIVAPGELVPGIPAAVDALVIRALERQSEDRYQSAGELGERIEELLAAMRPALGQADLARYLVDLFGRQPETAAPGSAEPPPSLPPTETVAEPEDNAGSAWADRAAIAVSGAAGQDRAAAPASAAAEPVPAVAPVGFVEPEEGGSRGKWLLVAAIVLAILGGGLLVWYLLDRRGEGGEAPAVQESSAEAESVLPGSEEAGGEGEEPDVTGEQGQGPAEEGEAQDGAEAPAAEELQQGIEAKLAEREEALRRQFEAELAARERALQQQLTELQESQTQ